MRTLTLTVSEKAYQKLKVIFSLFGEKDLRVFDEEFDDHKRFLQKERAEVKMGNASFITIDDAEKDLDALIESHENSI